MLISRALARGSKTVQAPTRTPTLLLVCYSPIDCQVFWTTPRGLSGRMPHLGQGNPPPPCPRRRPIVNGKSHTSQGTRWSEGGERPGPGEGPHRGTVITPPARTDATTSRSCQAAAHPQQARPQAVRGCGGPAGGQVGTGAHHRQTTQAASQGVQANSSCAPREICR